ncbi:DJ-1/PfpI family protein [archaeon]|jgi:protease I|nr:DJ-1/PfpI family protein [archaeon]MBT5021485.1 DJ-1/PfpI family protein [Candidatus Woesearchaeota archaeon]MBT3451513.1 DJ-1/PfpI family protein [archaeon]MBT6869506.1 DJ-1/PfpI family protein [archaeon]MBT7193194.1 DJ-1/PfpI family protein [archaeon]
MKVLIIVAQENYQDHEYMVPKMILEKEGIETITASKQKGICQGSLGGSTEAELSLSEVNIEEYIAIIFVGGSGAIRYQQDGEVNKIIQNCIEKNKILAAICIAPTILAYSGILQGKKATVWNNDNQQSKLLEEKGVQYTNEDVTVDGKIITANGPHAAEQFGKTILKLLKKSRP